MFKESWWKIPRNVFWFVSREKNKGEMEFWHGNVGNEYFGRWNLTWSLNILEDAVDIEMLAKMCWIYGKQTKSVRQVEVENEKSVKPRSGKNCNRWFWVLMSFNAIFWRYHILWWYKFKYCGSWMRRCRNSWTGRWVHEQIGREWSADRWTAGWMDQT